LFSNPASTAIGENNKFKKTIPPRDPENNGVLLGPRNFTTNKKMKGNIESGYFDKPTFLATGDIFKNAATQSLRSNKDPF